MDYIVKNESGFRYSAVNGNGGACGLGQALPCKKMGCGLEFKDVDCQVNWVLNYVRQRYSTPTQALAHWLAKVPVDGKDLGHWY